MTYKGHVRGGMITLDDGVTLPDGTAVEVRPLTGVETLPAPSQPEESGLCGIWKDDRPAEDIIAELRSARSGFAGRSPPL